MKTYNDFLEVGESIEQRLQFIKSAISDHRSSDLYLTALIAEQYFSKKNVTIREYEKLLYNMKGEVIKDEFSPNYKMSSGFFNRFVTQEKSFLLGNGVSWLNKDTENKLGTDKKPFDTQLQDLTEMALIGGVAFGFFNQDHLDVFSVLEFVPLYDEENGALMAGIRFWQVDSDKPIRATLYEVDGYTDFIWNEKQRDGQEFDSEGRMLRDKRTYKEHISYSEVDGTEIYDGENYPSFPIVPLWGNKMKQSELVGLREQIDCFDLIKSGFANNVDDASIIYWLIQNAGGMDDMDLTKFLKKIKTIHAFIADDEGATAEPHTIDYPFEAREALLGRLEKDLYKDAMALNTDDIASGAVTATQIEASYEPLNMKADGLEYRLIEFINGVLDIAGIQGEKPTFTRSIIVNNTETISNLLQGANYLSEDYVVGKLLELLGDGDKVDTVLDAIDRDSLTKFSIEDSEK